MTACKMQKKRVDFRVGAVPAVAERACRNKGMTHPSTSCELRVRVVRGSAVLVFKYKKVIYDYVKSRQKVSNQKVSEQTHRCENGADRPCPGLCAAVAVVSIPCFPDCAFTPPSREA